MWLAMYHMNSNVWGNTAQKFALVNKLLVNIACLHIPHVLGCLRGKHPFQLCMLIYIQYLLSITDFCGEKLSSIALKCLFIYVRINKINM